MRCSRARPLRQRTTRAERTRRTNDSRRRSMAVDHSSALGWQRNTTCTLHWCRVNLDACDSQLPSIRLSATTPPAPTPPYSRQSRPPTSERPRRTEATLGPRERPRACRELFDAPAAEVLFTYGGTGANVIALQSILQPWEAVICPATAHITTDECGAAERFTGAQADRRRNESTAS